MAKEQFLTAKKPRSKVKAKKAYGRRRETVKFWSETLKDAVTIATGLLTLLGVAGATTVQPNQPVQSQQHQQQSQVPERQRDFAPRSTFAVLPPEIDKIITRLVKQLHGGEDREKARSKAFGALDRLRGTVLATEEDVKTARQLVDMIVNNFPQVPKKNPHAAETA